MAAAEFDRNGYDGTSLSRLSRSAGISIGALSFHFAAKGELASAVEDSGRAVTRRVVEGVTSRGGPALDTVSALVLALGGLIETDAAVRAAADPGARRRRTRLVRMLAPAGQGAHGAGRGTGAAGPGGRFVPRHPADGASAGSPSPSSWPTT
ncbi:TetR family transcriptional regulator [Streptomyces sp. NPDC090046]|uniref:TetR family transcriptional regulator n=1 Tax=Streptomyces sp. NPDC090046 TaxID=3365928 RepID=UPI00382680F7